MRARSIAFTPGVNLSVQRSVSVRAGTRNQCLFRGVDNPFVRQRHTAIRTAAREAPAIPRTPLRGCSSPSEMTNCPLHFSAPAAPASARHACLSISNASGACSPSEWPARGARVDTAQSAVSANAIAPATGPQLSSGGSVRAGRWCWSYQLQPTPEPAMPVPTPKHHLLQRQPQPALRWRAFGLRSSRADVPSHARAIEPENGGPNWVPRLGGSLSSVSARRNAREQQRSRPSPSTSLQTIGVQPWPH